MKIVHYSPCFNLTSKCGIGVKENKFQDMKQISQRDLKIYSNASRQTFMGRSKVVLPVVLDNKDRIIELYKAGNSPQKIAEVIGSCSYRTIYRALEYWGVYNPPEAKPNAPVNVITARQKALNCQDDIISLHEADVSPEQIAAETGCDYKEVCKILHDYEFEKWEKTQRT